MQPVGFSVIAAAWSVFLLYWLVMAFGNKRTVRRQSSTGRVMQVLFGALAYLLLATGVFQVGELGRRILPETPTWEWTGAILTFAGLAFAVWARVRLGKNWSGTVTVKQDHRLIRSGPYRFVRHPIYSGLLLAVLGTALAVGRVRGFVALLVALIAWWSKWTMEEKFMLEEFGLEYVEYRRRTPAVIPFLR